MSLHSQIRQQLLDNLTPPQAEEAAQLNNALRLLSKWRSVLIQNTILQQQGTVVMDGPLKGLDFLQQSAEGCHIPKLLGCYEQPLLPHSPTHDITRVEDSGQRQLPHAPVWFNNLAHLDQLLAVWEWRSGPTPWLVMKAKPGRQR